MAAENKLITVGSTHCTTVFTLDQWQDYNRSLGVECKNCKFWVPPSDWQVECGNKEGMCMSIPAYGGAFHNAGTHGDDFCNQFYPKDNG